MLIIRNWTAQYFKLATLTLRAYNKTMDLHRTTGKPDWEEVSPSKRTAIQKLAFASRGIITPPNLITLIGLIIVMYGLVALLQQLFWTGLIALAVGRLLDVLDGLVAQKTGTKSPLGELLDATVDKIGTVLTFVVLYIGGISFWWLITILLLPQVIIPFVILYKRTRNIQIHPTRAGKLSMATLWVSLVGLILIKALALTGLHPLAISVYVVSLVSTALGFYALWQYSTDRD